MHHVYSLQMALLTGMFAVGLLGATSVFAADAHTTTKFEGVKADSGTAAHSRQGGNDTLTWSDDFKIPDTPAPHWQVVDSKGNVFLLQRLKIKGDKENRTIVLPPYVHDVAKVQIWCAWAEVLLGEASFAKPIMTASGERMHAGSMAMSR
ncbi:MAG: hypothetical protein AB1555_16380 [Nitrospirota bacterium]